jgi:hypothetical protein
MLTLQKVLGSDTAFQKLLLVKLMASLPLIMAHIGSNCSKDLIKTELPNDLLWVAKPSKLIARALDAHMGADSDPVPSPVLQRVVPAMPA